MSLIMNSETDVFLREEQITNTVNITNPNKPEIGQNVFEKWQKIIDLIA